MTGSQRRMVAAGLTRLLADAFMLSFKLRHLLWRGRSEIPPSTDALLTQFRQGLEEQLEQLARAVIALGGSIPHDPAGLTQRSSIKPFEDDGAYETALRQIGLDHLQITDDIDNIATIMGADLPKELRVSLEAMSGLNADYAEQIAALLES